MNAKGAALGGEDKLITEPKDRAHIIAIYENPEEDIILFNCYMNTESMNLQIGEDTQLIDAYVSNIPADLYIDNTSGAVNHLDRKSVV